MKESVRAIAYPLPEDIEKLKWGGWFTECLSVIDRRMGENIPQVLREKLAVEKVQIERMLSDYVITTEEAQKKLSENLTDWKPEELDVLRRENVVDWIFVDGEIRYIDNFYSNLIKIRPDLAARRKNVPQSSERTEAEIRDEMMAGMKKNGGVTAAMKIRARMEVQLTPEQENETLRVWLPLPVVSDQIKEVEIISTNVPYRFVADETTPQRTVYFEGKAKDLAHTEMTYSVKNYTDYQELDPTKVSSEQPRFYLHEELPHISFTPYLRDLTAEVVGEETNPLLKARRIYDFVTTKVVYSYMRNYSSLPVIPEYCASRLRGDCGVQALTFITMCRIAGVPARWQSGLYANENDAGCHDWAMFYVAPYGWRLVDCSFGGAAWRDGAKERWDFYFGNMDPYRVVLASEFQSEFVPTGDYFRGDPYDNQMGETEFLGKPISHLMWHGHADMLELHVEYDK